MPDQVSTRCERRVHVLIVDDSPKVRQELSLLLELTGEVKVTGEASNGVQAIHQCEALRPEVVVMDLEMPVMDGYTATRQIKAGFPGCRVIGLTIYGGEAERQQALSAGMVEILIKGAPLEILLQAIRAGRADEGISKGEAI